MNTNGQVGVGTNANVYIPTKIPQVGAVTSVSAGSYHTCVISIIETEFDLREDEDGRKEDNVYCFGVNYFGQLGIGNKEDQQLPQKVDLVGPAKEIKAGRDHTCALMENGTVKVFTCQNMRAQLKYGRGLTLVFYCFEMIVLGQQSCGSIRNRYQPGTIYNSPNGGWVVRCRKIGLGKGTWLCFYPIRPNPLVLGKQLTWTIGVGRRDCESISTAESCYKFSIERL